ncbi:hypothetical protein [uncultured Ferrimonas sp.]|uniref:hypothetical protein n=1 Tax=uncultured Ferrimonas sp. TaxID=432640 RepID=UPI002616E92D|nr:hypothetical protein [uncultured Ferrimonas sp.]
MKMDLLVPVLAITVFAAVAAPKNGEMRQQDGQWQTWQQSQQQWQPTEQFWQAYAASKDSRFWGSSVDYPNYQQVNEFDTFLVQTPQGSCLMEFFHGRWRRANDVRRWDPQHNDALGCPYVFD